MRILTLLSLLLALTACGLGQYVPPLVTDTPLPSNTPICPEPEAPTPTAHLSPTHPPRIATGTTPAILATAAVTETCTVTTGISDGHLNLRACAGVDCSILAWLSEGERAQIQATAANGWLEVQTAGGVTGWVNGAFCRRTP